MNEYINQVIYGTTTLIDLTNDTAEPADVVTGKYFHLANGERTSGTANYAPLDHNHDDRYYTETEIDTKLSGKLDLTGGTLTGHLNSSGYDLRLNTTGSNSDASGDIVFNYGNDQEKMRIWTTDTYTTIAGPLFRQYKKDGTLLFSGKLALSNTVMYFYQQTTKVTTASTAEFCRVENSYITADTVVLECAFTDYSAIGSVVTWTTGAGYISLKGICSSTNCKVNLTLGQKGN